MGQVADILSSPEWAAKSPLEKAQAQRDLFTISLRDNPDLASAFGSADDAGKQTVVDAWKDQVRTAFPDAFTTKGFRIESVGKNSVTAHETASPVYDVATEQIIASARDPKKREEFAALPEEQRHAIAPFLYERVGMGPGTGSGPESVDPIFGNPSDFIEETDSEGKAAAKFAIPAILRIGPTVAASITKNPKIIAGAAAAGDAAAQGVEKMMGTRQSFSPVEMGLNAGLSILPAAVIGKFANPALNMAARAGVRAAEGAAQGATFEAVRGAVDDGEVSGANVGAAALFGAGLGSLIGGFEPKIAALLTGKTKGEALDTLAGIMAKASPGELPALTAAQKQIEDSIGVTAQPTAEQTAARAADVSSAINEGGINQTPQSAAALAARLAEQERLSAQFAQGKTAELVEGGANALESAKAGQLAGDESVTFGDNRASTQVAHLDSRPGNAASERARLAKKLEQPQVDDGSLSENVELSPQAQRMTDQYGRINPSVITSLGGGTAGTAYGFTQGDTPEERAANALKYGILGFGVGTAGGWMLNRAAMPAVNRRPSKYSAYLDELAKGTDGMPAWYLNVRATEPIVRLRGLIVNSRARVKDAVASVPGKIDEEANPYLAGKLFPGKVAARVKLEAENAAQAAVWNRDKAADLWGKATGGIADDFNGRLNEYMVAKTAPDYNREHAEFARETGKPAAGMSDQQAAHVLAKAKADGLDSVFEDLRKQVRAIDESVMDVLEDAELFSASEAAALRKKYPEHVPLNRILPDADDSSIAGAIFGIPRFGVQTSGLKSGYGSDLQVDDIYESVLTNLKDAIIRAERNKVALATVAFFRGNAIAADVRVRKPTVVGTGAGGVPILERPDANTTLVAREVADPSKPSSQVWVEFKDPLLAGAFNGLNSEQTGPLLRWIGAATRTLAGLYTRFNLGFVPSNKLRDIQEAFTVSATSGDLKAAIKMPLGMIDDMRVVSDGVLGRNTPRAASYHRMMKEGAFSGGLASSTRDVSARSVAQMGRRNVAQKTGDIVIGFFDFINDVAENSTRVGAYRVAKGAGASPALSALSSREIGVDFNQKGTLTPQAGALFAFINPGIQGGVRAAKAVIRNPQAVAAAATGFVAVGMATDTWNKSIDPDWKKRKAMQFYRGTSIPLIMGQDAEGYYVFTMPVAQMLRPVKAAMDFGIDLANDEIADVKSAAARAGQVAADSLTPIGGQNFRQAITPTVGDPLSDMWANESYTGSKISPQGSPGAPAFTRVYSNTRETAAGQAAMATARLLRDMGVDVTPEDLLYGVKGYAGGPGELASQIGSLAKAAMSGEIKVEPRDIPVLSRFVRYVRKDSPAEDAAANRIIRDEQTKSGDTKLVADQRAASILKALPNMSREQKLIIAQELNGNPVLTSALERALKRESDDLKPWEREASNLPVRDGSRARFVGAYIRSKPQGERRAIFERLKEKKIVTAEVEQQIAGGK